MNRSVVTVALGCTLVLAACGGGSDRMAVASGGSSPAAASPTTFPDDPPPPVIEPRQNRNRKDVPLGMVCWAHKAAVYRVIDLLQAGHQPQRAADPEAAATSALADTASTLVQAARELPAASTGLPPQVRPFYERLVAATNAAQGAVTNLPPGKQVERAREAYSRLSSIFDFEAFPGVRDFVAAAEASPDVCPDL